MINAVTVFAGARGGAELMPDTRLIGAELAKRDITTYYGGSRKGVMGALADGYKDWVVKHPGTTRSGQIIGVLPESIAALNHFDADLVNIVTPDMASRKAVFWSKSDAFLCLPGGAGTMDELTEIWTETKLGHQRSRPIVVYNADGFYSALETLIRRMVWQGCVPQDRANLIKFVSSPIAAVNALFAEPVSYAFNSTHG